MCFLKCKQDRESTPLEKMFIQELLSIEGGTSELRPFRSIKKRVARMFWKRNSFSDSSRATSTQTVANTEQCKMEEKDSETDSDKGEYSL